MTVSSSRRARRVSPALISHALEVAGRLANDATDVITATAGRGARPTAKESPFDWVTDTDRTLERHTRRVLTAEFPGIPVVGEEFGADVGAAESEYRWVVDPVDGTANYVAGMPWCAYSLALMDADGPVVGVVADPYRGQIYAAARGRGARANGSPGHHSRRAPSVAGAIVCTELTRAGRGPACRSSSRGPPRPTPGCASSARQRWPWCRWRSGTRRRPCCTACTSGTWPAGWRWPWRPGAAVLDRHGGTPALPGDGLLVAAPGVADEVLGWWTGAAAH